MAPLNGHRLPVTWPLVVLFVLFPLWWVLGVVAFVWPAVAVLMLVALLRRRLTRAPVAMILWFAFSSWVLMSGMQLQAGTKVLTFSYRLSMYVTAAILFLYIYNLPRSGRMDTKVLRALTAFWIFVVVGGYLGILLRGAIFIPPFEHLLPHSLRSKQFVLELVRPVFAEVQNFLGFPVPRPAAPFAYTNQWGGNMAVLTPIAFAAIAAAGPGRRRKILVGVLVASLVPMVVSLNRGMVLTLTGGILYVTVRLALRGRIRALASVLGLAAVVVIVMAATPLGHLVVASFSSTHGHSNSTRFSLYQQASAGANASPMFGYGAPQQSVGQAGLPAIGTQGQLWLILYSNGYPALVLFVASILTILWQTRRARGMIGLWLHTAVLIALAQIVVYGWLPYEVQVVMAAAALAYRRCGPPAPPPDRSRPDALSVAGDPGSVAVPAGPRAPVPSPAAVP